METEQEEMKMQKGQEKNNTGQPRSMVKKEFSKMTLGARINYMGVDINWLGSKRKRRKRKSMGWACNPLTKPKFNWAILLSSTTVQIFNWAQDLLGPISGNSRPKPKTQCTSSFRN